MKKSQESVPKDSTKLKDYMKVVYEQKRYYDDEEESEKSKKKKAKKAKKAKKSSESESSESEEEEKDKPKSKSKAKEDDRKQKDIQEDKKQKDKKPAAVTNETKAAAPFIDVLDFDEPAGAGAAKEASAASSWATFTLAEGAEKKAPEQVKPLISTPPKAAPLKVNPPPAQIPMSINLAETRQQPHMSPAFNPMPVRLYE